MTSRMRSLLLVAATTALLSAQPALAQTGKGSPPRPKAAPKQPAQQKPVEPTTDVNPDAAEAQPEVEIEVDPNAAPPAEGEPAPEIEVDPNAPPPAEAEPAPPVEVEISEAETKAAGPPPKRAESQVSWQDIVVVVRKPFLKQNRLELIPAVGITLNDNMIRHFMLNGQLNYWLTDVLAVGLEAQLFTHQFLEPYDLVGRQYRRLPTLNQYNFGGALNFSYVPIYAKFAMFDKHVVHWEAQVNLGVGVTQSQIVPRDPALSSWTNMLLTPNFGVTTRVFLAQWITFDLGVRNYAFVDKFENVNRMTNNVEQAKSEADTQLINHVMITAGLSFWLPTSFEYTTFR